MSGVEGDVLVDYFVGVSPLFRPPVLCMCVRVYLLV